MASMAAAMIKIRNMPTRKVVQLYKLAPTADQDKLYKHVLAWLPSDLRATARASTAVNSKAPMTASLAVTPIRFPR